MTTKTKAHRRARGSGSVYKIGRTFWIQYYGADRLRHKESTNSTRKGDAERLLEKRVGSREHNLPLVRRAETLTFNDAAQAVLDDFTDGKSSIAVVRRRIDKHLLPVFTGKRMASITSADVTAFIAHRQVQGVVNKRGVRTGDVSNAEINRELQTLKRAFNLALEGGRLAMKPRIKMLRESAARAFSSANSARVS
jgi:hypothetical protein